MEAILAPLRSRRAIVEAIRRMYPDGPKFFTRYGRRVEEPALEPWRRGYKANINGETHWFTSEGQFVAAGTLATPTALELVA